MEQQEPWPGPWHHEKMPFMIQVYQDEEICIILSLLLIDSDEDDDDDSEYGDEWSD